MKAIAKTLSLFALATKFPDEASVVAFFEKWRWGGKPECPRCNGGENSPRPERNGHWCKSCRRCFTVRTGTVFEESRLPLRKWLFAMYLMQTARKGVSALQLSKELDISYRSAWFMAHRLREACAATGELLSGMVEVDETYIGGLERNKHDSKKLKAGRGAVGKTPVIGLRQRNGRTITMPIPDTTGPTLQKAVRENVAAGSVIFTDEHGGYKALDGEEFAHYPVNHSAKEFVNHMAHTNGIESVWAVLKRGFHGTYHHWSVKHLPRYVDEFSFRLNEGNVRVDTIDRLGAMIQGANGRRLTYKGLVA